MSFSRDGNSLGVLYLGYAIDPTSDNNKGAQTQLLIWDFDSGLVKESFYDFDVPNPITFAYSPDGSKFFTASFVMEAFVCTMWKLQKSMSAGISIPAGVKHRSAQTVPW